MLRQALLPAAVRLTAALGDERAAPFGTAPNDLRPHALLHTLDGIVLDALGEPAPPERYRLT